MTWHDVCSLDDVPADRGWPVVVGDRRIAVFRGGPRRGRDPDAAGRVWALDNACAHVGSPIDDGLVADGCVTCPWHGWCYDLATGRHLTTFGPRAGVATHPARVVDGRVWVAVADRP